jgi:hypothetical protein
MKTLTDEMMERLAAHRARRQEQTRDLWEMTSEERVDAMWSGRLTGSELLDWARRRPHEVPQIEGEFAFLALNTPEVAEADERQR